jgi:hypothetical protein
MNYSFLLSVAVWGLVQALPAAAQTTPPTSTSATDASPVQLTCRSFSGHVQSTTGTPLVGATVLVKGTYVARTTNDEGYFTFDLPSVPTQAPRLQVSSAGFAPQEFLITTCAPMSIELQMLEGTRIKQRGKRKGFIKQVGKE